jgi:thioredoxin reductase
MTVLDVAIVGAGPAGLAAATACAGQGLSVSVYDEQASPGGQIYRGITASPLARTTILGDDYWHGATLLRPFEMSGARYVREATVWSIANDGSAFALDIAHGPPGARTTLQVEARVVILATGALERPFAVPGWTLPGVMAAGAAQILLKTAGVVPCGRTVLAGCGPLLWLLAAQYLRAGVAIDCLLDTTPRGRLPQVLRHVPGFVLSDYFAKARALVQQVRRQVHVIEHVDALAIDGEDAATTIRYAAAGTTHERAVDHMLLHQGVVPDVNLANAAGCALTWDEAQACFTPAVDAWGGSSVPGIFVAGDAGGIGGIGGALAAEARGRIAALAAANAIGRIDADTRARLENPHRRALARALRGRRFFEALYRPADTYRAPVGATIVCRCEEVPASTIVDLARDGCAGPNQMKAYTRCGMGPCQGRLCGLTVTEIIAREQQRTPADVGYYRLRTPAKPVTLGELAAVPITPEAAAAVARVPETARTRAGAAVPGKAP